MTGNIYSIYKLSYSISNSRGKQRQHEINNAIISYLSSKEEFKHLTFKTEINIPSHCGRKKTFSIDVIGYNVNNEIEILVLGKAPASNIAQNENNFIVGRAGEILRPIQDTKIIFVTFLPNETPYFKEKGIVKHFETNSPEYVSKWENILFLRDFDEIFITFDIEGISNCKTREDVDKLFLSGNPIVNVNIQQNNYKKPKIVYE